MEKLATEVYEYLKLTWLEEDDLQFAAMCDVYAAIQNYGVYMKKIVPKDACNPHYKKYIHKERILYDQHMNDEIMCFLYEIKDDDSDETDSMYSEAELETDSEPTEFIGGFKVMDDYDYREQLTANEFTGGYWDPKIHWVISKKFLRNLVNNN